MTFSEIVTGVDVSDFALATTGTAAGTIAYVTGSGSSYSVTVNGVSGDGNLGLNLVDDDSIIDVVGNPLGGVGLGNGNLTGQTYSIDNTPPMVLSVNRHVSNPITNATSVQFDVTFSERCRQRSLKVTSNWTLVALVLGSETWRLIDRTVGGVLSTV